MQPRNCGLRGKNQIKKQLFILHIHRCKLLIQIMYNLLLLVNRTRQTCFIRS
jgi:hypothetical protein